MDNHELKSILASLYGFTAMELVQQVSAINALERTLEDIKNGAKCQSVDLAIEAAISTLESVKSSWSINSERSENTESEVAKINLDISIRNIDRIRTMTAGELGDFLKKVITSCSDTKGYKCSICPLSNSISCTKDGFAEWLLEQYNPPYEMAF